MKKCKALICSMLIGAMVFALTGCCGYEIVVKDVSGTNDSFNVSRRFGYDPEISTGGMQFTVNGKSYGESLSQDDGEHNIMTYGYGDRSVLTKTLDVKAFGESVNIGTVNIGMQLGDLTDGISDHTVEIVVNEGLDAEGLFEKYGNTINMYLGSSVVNEYKNGDSATRERIEDKWFPNVVMRFEFTGTASCYLGDKYVTISGGDVSVNIGQAMRDGGARIVFYAGNSPVNGNPVDYFDTWYAEEAAVLEELNGQSQASDKGFDDVDASAWYAEAVQYCVDRGIMSGYGNGKFGPNDPVTAAQLCQIMFNNGLNEDEYLYDILNIDHWAKTAVGWCTYNNLILDYDIEENGAVTTSKLDQGLTRQQAIAALARLAGFKGIAPTGSIPNIPDLMDINYRYRDTIKLAYQYGLTSGVDNTGLFSPESSVTRAQVCQMMYNMGW